jgi:membrane protein DedA with SNARE-associated domain
MKLNNESIRKIIRKYGHVLRLKIEDIDKTMGLYKRYEVKTVFFGRMIPMVRSLISIPAGMARMNFSVFVLLTTLGSLIWNTILILAGYVLGSAWRDIIRFTSAYSSITLIIFIIIGILSIVYFLGKRNNTK